MQKRFIAGATCPQCQQQDSLRAWTDADGAHWRDCVDCGYVEKQQIQVTATASLKTRVDPQQEEQQTIRIITPPTSD